VLDQVDGGRAGTGRVATTEILDALRREATAVLEEDRAMCRRIGEWGAPLLADGTRLVTHCNAGALATSGMGTALAPVYVATENGRHIEVFAGETRPLLQGARLTAWELSRAGVPVTVVPDGAVASLMRAGKVDLCIVGADRIAVNGDVANKIGTYAVAVAARHHGIPFYVAAPTSTIDLEAASGADIPIEERSRAELTAPDAAAVFNPAFDVTPADLISGIITDTGLYRPPYRFDRSA
jgi:methylthioribose-1-phosphate isomerase